MAEKHNGPLSLAPVGGLDALEVLKLTAIVHRDALEQLIEQLAKTALQAVDGLDYAGRRVVLQQHHNAHTGPALGEDQEGFFGALASHDTVHLPMTKTAPALDLLGAVFNALAVGAPGGLPLALGGVVAAALVVQVLRGEVEEHIPTVWYIEFSNHLVADSIAESAGVKTAMFHTCHNVSADDLAAGATYVSLMEQNLETLRENL